MRTRVVPVDGPPVLQPPVDCPPAVPDVGQLSHSTVIWSRASSVIQSHQYIYPSYCYLV